MLGATPTYDLNDADWEAAVAEGTATATEWPIHLSGGIPGPQQMAANFALFYDFNVLMIDNDSLDDLDTGQADDLREAAATALQRSIDERVRDDAAFRDACVQGGNLTTAPSTFITEVGRALDDWVLDKLEDPATSEMYDTVKRVAGAHAVPEPQECPRRHDHRLPTASTARHHVPRGHLPQPATHRRRPASRRGVRRHCVEQ